MPQLKDINVDWVSLVSRAAVRDPQNKSEPRRFMLWKHQDANPPEGGNHMDTIIKTAEELAADLAKAEKDALEATEKHEAELQKAQDALKKAEEERDAAVAKADTPPKKAPTTDGDGDGDEDESEQEMSKAMQAKLEKAEADRVALEKRVTDAEELAKSERDLRVTSEFITKAEGYTSLSVKPAEFGPVLKRISEKVEKADFEVLEQLLDASNEQVSKGDLYRELGSSVGGQAKPDTAYAEVQQKAEVLRKSDPKLSKGEAEARVMSEDRELQARHVAESRGAAMQS